jgi:uncharacterized protein YndB with AHSA1/START domain
MSSARDNPPEDPAVPEIVNTRRFAASATDCFAAFRDPARLARWWGPAGFMNVVPEFDFRPGGRWCIVMRGPDGQEYPNESEFLEIVPDARIRFLHLGPMHRYWLTMSYAPDAGGCRLTWHMRFATIAEYAKVKDFVFAANEQNFDRLAACLAGSLSENPPSVR